MGSIAKAIGKGVDEVPVPKPAAIAEKTPFYKKPSTYATGAGVAGVGALVAAGAVAGADGGGILGGISSILFGDNWWIWASSSSSSIILVIGLAVWYYMSKK